MTARFLVGSALGMLFCACHTAPVDTYADVEANVARMRADWERSQLTDHPQQNLLTRDRRYELFFRLPLSERAVVVMDSFANADLDGELAFMMGQMLLCRTQAASAIPGSRGATPAFDRAYTAALFQTIESHSESQVRRFCYDEARYQRFQRNLRHWKAYCQAAEA